MQPVDSKVAALLQSENLRVSAGLEVLNDDLSLSRDISDALVGGYVDWDFTASITGTCSITIAERLAWGLDLVRPYVSMFDGFHTVRLNQGVFTMVTPERRYGELPETYEVQGMDRSYFLDRPVGDSYVAQGDVLQAVRSALAAAGITSGILLDGSAAGKTLPTPMVFPMITEQPRLDDGTFTFGEYGPTTWLHIVNTLLKQVAYRPIYCDHNGLFRSGPMVDPAKAGEVYTFDADDERTTVDMIRTVVEDKWKVPSHWIFVRSNMPGDPPAEPVEGAGIYRWDKTKPGERERTKLVEVGVADQASLVAFGNTVIAADERVGTTIKLNTAPFPVLGHYDVYRYRDAKAGLDRKVQALTARVDLGIGDTEWLWEAV